MNRFATAMLSVIALTACSSEPPPAQENHAHEHAIQEPLDKARAVEDALMKAKQEQDAKIEEQGG
jgi:hypothetical protein